MTYRWKFIFSYGKLQGRHFLTREWGEGVQGFRLLPCRDPAVLNPSFRGCPVRSSGHWKGPEPGELHMGWTSHMLLSFHWLELIHVVTLSCKGAGKYGLLLWEENRLGERYPLRTRIRVSYWPCCAAFMFLCRRQPRRGCFLTLGRNHFIVAQKSLNFFSCL